ncbi:nitrate reductase molybdenum cofactor assembly chaperone [Ferroglobus placidus DSM 10642]|uniref:Nitrate reductase molybdenum cofactor assembly chaperone n=1 Tax=Ferroglobus placidus (strain DSM 10642 / AEDII12DO) TaxID=589924 RepID=D3S2G3_FERPA|nr:nitrate reductase molybdenum cofactor assembly chaperone [Ferroglobus placidus]ADC64493.1 nitrate reductase molybdenum cofactor assembly chaperone [Ferroglobus placidus DSM 10642]
MKKMKDCYKLLSKLLQYPSDLLEMRDAAKKLYKLIRGIEAEEIEEAKKEFEKFIEFLEKSTIEEIEEEYVRTFDLFPLCPPYVFHHVCGESYRRSEYLVKLMEIYRKHGFEPDKTLKKELPDHIAVIVSFLGELDDRRDFLEFIIKGINKMTDTVKKKETPYRALILLTHALCSADLKFWSKKLEGVIEC